MSDHETGTVEITAEELLERRRRKRGELGLPPEESTSSTPSGRDSGPTRISALTPQIIQGTCPRCGTVPVQGVRTLAGRELLPPCPACAIEMEREVAERAEQERRARTAAAADERRRRIRELLERCGVDAGSDHLEVSFETFRPEPDRVALETARRVVAEFQRGGRPNLYLFSKRPGEQIAAGAGKTHLAVSILRELLISGDVTPETARFVRETRLTITLRRLIQGGQPEDYLDGLIRCELLIMDDVGKAKTDSAWLRELLFELVAGREPRSTIVTSNFAPDELEARDDWYAPLLSRLIGKGPAVELSGPDWRLERRGSLTLLAARP